MRKLSVGIYIILILSTLSFSPVLANESLETSHDDTLVIEKFNAGKFIIEHVSDSYEWHVVSFGDKHISIPLPVILYSKNPDLHEGKNFHVVKISPWSR